ncbi:hypothetical protein GPALN_010920 [Globodera pallida]|nr:hypothetical protein GPALN_010920 [Globodera pallida]
MNTSSLLPQHNHHQPPTRPSYSFIHSFLSKLDLTRLACPMHVKTFLFLNIPMECVVSIGLNASKNRANALSLWLIDKCWLTFGLAQNYGWKFIVSRKAFINSILAAPPPSTGRVHINFLSNNSRCSFSPYKPP